MIHLIQDLISDPICNPEPVADRGPAGTLGRGTGARKMFARCARGHPRTAFTRPVLWRLMVFSSRIVALPVALVLLAACSSGDAAPSAETAQDGGAAPQVTVEYTVAPTPLPPTATPEPTPTVTPIPTATPIPLYTLTGTVMSADGKALPGTQISIGTETVSTGEDGSFTLGPVLAGTVEVFRPAWKPTSLALTEDANVALTLEPITVRALRVSAYSELTPAVYDNVLALAEGSSVNALVFDTKDESGHVRYETSVQQANDYRAVEAVYDPVAAIARAKEAGLYTITRIVSFEDPIRANADPGARAAGSWIDAYNRDNWKYMLDLAVEACEIGFDEIQFDYVRFPTGVGGYARPAEADRVEAITEYLTTARDLLHPLGCALSADIFGIVLNSPDDQGIGQTPEALSSVVDAISPMIYPSHYNSGWLGLANPNSHPALVVADALDDGLPRLDGPAIMRPWLQAFYYNSDQIRVQIEESEERGLGWILWEAGGSYSSSALPAPLPEEEADSTSEVLAIPTVTPVPGTELEDPDAEAETDETEDPAEDAAETGDPEPTAGGYTEAVRASWTDKCVALVSDPAFTELQRASCGCSYDAISAQVSFADFREVESGNVSDPSDVRVLTLDGLIQDCFQRLREEATNSAVLGN